MLPDRHPLWVAALDRDPHHGQFRSLMIRPIAIVEEPSLGIPTDANDTTREVDNRAGGSTRDRKHPQTIGVSHPTCGIGYLAAIGGHGEAMRRIESNLSRRPEWLSARPGNR